ncbi:MAG: hypothetical protein QOK39_2808 [Acidimicrobiaceae bacterium]|jgi:hypothetical protein|nr:hypothetical protein [Acidimicrobiaceae bacterium]
MKHSTRVYLAVPYKEKNEAKALGAQWDPRQRCWYVPEASELAPFEQWLTKWALDPGDTICLPVLLLPAACPVCRRSITCVVGLHLPEDLDVQPSGVVHDVAFLAVEDCGEVLDLLLDPSARAPLMIGPLLYRRTRIRPDGYVANTCVHCGATQGAFPLHEDLMGFIGGDPSRIPLLWSDGLEVDYPLAALNDREAPHDEPDLAPPAAIRLDTRGRV